jgi:hypothetical protein
MFSIEYIKNLRLQKSIIFNENCCFRVFSKNRGVFMSECTIKLMKKKQKKKTKK